MKNQCDVEPAGIRAESKELLLSPLEKICAWNIIQKEHGFSKLGKYFYLGMKSPSPMPTSWWEVDCFLLGLLTERKCKLLSQESKDFIEHYVLGERYKKYRRLLKSRSEIIAG